MMKNLFSSASASLLSLVITLVCASSLKAQSVTTAYDLSKISSYVELANINEGAAKEVMDSIASMHERFRSVDFVVNVLNTSDYDVDEAMALMHALEATPYRYAFLAGPHTGRGAAMIMHYLMAEKKAIFVGDVTSGGLKPHVQLKADDAYLTDWYKRLHAQGVLPEAAKRYVEKNATADKKVFEKADVYVRDFDDNAALFDMINEVAAEKGIAEDKDGFFYSAFTVLAEIKAEVARCIFPDNKVAYFKSLNSSINTAIMNACDVMESPAYRELLQLEGNPGVSSK